MIYMSVTRAEGEGNYILNGVEVFHSKCMYVLAYNIKHTISVANL